MSHNFKTGSHSIFCLTYHMVFVTKYRRKCLTTEMLSYLENLFANLCSKWEAKLLEFGGEPDHVHLLVSLNPKIQPSKLVNNLKPISSRMVRQQYANYLRRFYWKPLFWTDSYCILTTGGATIDTIRKYIENQGAVK